MPFPIKMGLTIIVILVAAGAYFYQGLHRSGRTKIRGAVPWDLHGGRHVGLP